MSALRHRELRRSRIRPWSMSGRLRIASQIVRHCNAGLIYAAGPRRKPGPVPGRSGDGLDRTTNANKSL